MLLKLYFDRVFSTIPASPVPEMVQPYHKLQCQKFLYHANVPCFHKTNCQPGYKYMVSSKFLYEEYFNDSIFLRQKYVHGQNEEKNQTNK